MTFLNCSKYDISKLPRHILIDTLKICKNSLVLNNRVVYKKNKNGRKNKRAKRKIS